MIGRGSNMLNYIKEDLYNKNIYYHNLSFFVLEIFRKF